MIGAIIGDVVGSRFEFNNIKTKDFELVVDRSCFTDDTVMTVAVSDVLINGDPYNKDDVIDTLKKWGKKYPYAGYGGHFFDWVLGSSRKPYNSCGNGSAMRVSAAGWVGKTEEEVTDLAKRVTEVTHNHPEGIKGAIVTALSIYYARMGKSKEFLREYMEREYPEIKKLDYEELRRTYRHEAEICQVTLPEALYCFLISTSFEDCLRTTISIGGDCDTTSAISCAIAEAFYKKIPESLVKAVRRKLPKEMLDVVDKI